MHLPESCQFFLQLVQTLADCVGTGFRGVENYATSFQECLDEYVGVADHGMGDAAVEHSIQT